MYKWCYARVEIDRRRDGRVDAVVERSYDGASNVVREVEDDDANGWPDRITTQTFDDNGNLVESSIDRDNDGTADSVRTITYDQSGRAERQETDDNMDGYADWIVRYSCNASGEMDSESIDYEGDGSPDLVLRLVYTSHHRLAAIAAYSGPYLHLASLGVETWEDDVLIGYQLIDFDIPALSMLGTYNYDEAGRLVRIREYEGVDGSSETILTYTYNEAGWLAERMRVRDGELQGRTDFTYDGVGRVLEQIDFDHIVGPRSYDDEYRCP